MMEILSSFFVLPRPLEALHLRPMEAIFKRLLITHKKTRPALRGAGDYSLRQVRGIVIHWTANEARGADALANRNYFNNGSPGEKGPQAASAHYIIDDRTIIQCLPETEVGFHCGDTHFNKGKYKPEGLHMKEGFPKLTPNYFTLGLEMCVNKGSNWDLTYQHTVGFTAELMLKYPDAELLRHYDITGKPCPKPFLDFQKYIDFRLDVQQRYQMLEKISFPAVVVCDPADPLNVRSGPHPAHTLLYSLLRNERVLVYKIQDGWAQIGNDRWVNAKYLQPIQPAPAV